MGLKRQVSSLEDVPEALHDQYKEQDDGTYVLDVEDDPKVGEFRSRNIQLDRRTKELEAQLERYKGVDPEKYRKALEALEKIEGDEERKLLEDGKIDDVIERRIGAMRSDFEKQIKALTTARDDASKERDTFRGRLGEVLIDTHLAKAVNTVGKVREGALEDVIARGRRTFSIDENGQMVPSVNGETVYGKKGDALTPEEWANSLLESAPHLFEGGSGSGSSGGGGKGAGGGKAVGWGDPSFADNIDGVIDGSVRVKPS
ncbi:MAG: hypothetical protein RL885_25040 [Planctomycetota bacterium]